jgi:glutamyl-tRNA reductase
MPLRVIGCSHHDCPVGLREQLAVPRHQIREVLDRFQRHFPHVEAVLLSTCNRTELYTACDSTMAHPTHEETIAFLARDRGILPDSLDGKITGRIGEEAVRHLFSVAASLDSMVIGETQILAQIKGAYQTAIDAACSGEYTHRAFQAALRVAKRVARETHLHQHRVSVPSVAIQDFLPRVFETLEDKEILIVGAGEMAQEALRYLVQAGAKRFHLSSRNIQQARNLAYQLGGNVCDWSSLSEKLVDADLVVSATASPDFVVSYSEFRKLEPRRNQRPLFMLDLAVPRDIDPQIGDCLGVYLYSMDDLEEACAENKSRRGSEMPKAKQIVEEETRLFIAEARRQKIAPSVRQLRETADEIRLSELDRLLRRIPTIDPDAREEISRMTERIVNKILHPPLETLRGGDPEPTAKPTNLLDAFKRLFQLGDS